MSFELVNKGLILPVSRAARGVFLSCLSCFIDSIACRVLRTLQSLRATTAWCRGGIGRELVNKEMVLPISELLARGWGVRLLDADVATTKRHRGTKKGRPRMKHGRNMGFLVTVFFMGGGVAGRSVSQGGRAANQCELPLD